MQSWPDESVLHLKYQVKAGFAKVPELARRARAGRKF